MAKKIWLDTMVANEYGARLIPHLEDFFEKGFTVVSAETAVDIRGFHGNHFWLKQHIVQDHIIIEAFYPDFDSLTAKAFTWSSMNGLTTQASSSFVNAIRGVPAETEIAQLRDVIDKYCIEKEKWIVGRPPYQASGELSTEIQAFLNLPDGATRTDILAAAKKQNRMDLFDKFNLHYVEGLARQHGCQYVLTLNTVILLPF